MVKNVWFLFNILNVRWDEGFHLKELFKSCKLILDHTYHPSPPPVLLTRVTNLWLATDFDPCSRRALVKSKALLLQGSKSVKMLFIYFQGLYLLHLKVKHCQTLRVVLFRMVKITVKTSQKCPCMHIWVNSQNRQLTGFDLYSNFSLNCSNSRTVKSV